ncbi:MAG: urease accessory protein UreE [Halovenus sp.]
MRRVEGVVGNTNDDGTLAERLAVHDEAGTLERVVLEAGERKKSRLRVETDAGTELGIVVDRPELLPGDVLVLEDDCAVVVTLDAREALVVSLPEPTPETLAAAVTLGHRVGNQHWDLAVRDGTVYIPVEADRHIVENVVEDHLPPGAETSYDAVDASLWLDGTPSHRGHTHGSATHGDGGSHE